MPQYSVFDIAGPIMVGPSSSHTAGACKIGQMARALFHTTPEKVIFYLHGSFGEVYKGHATDMALLAGAMKMKTSDPRIKNAFEMAKKKKIEYSFIPKNLGAKYHPNTVKIVMRKEGRKPMSIMGSSLGGGVISIIKINDFDTDIRETAGRYKTLVISHYLPKTLQVIINKIARQKIRIMRKKSIKMKGNILTILDTEGRRLTLKEVLELEKIPGIDFIRSLSKLPQ